MSFFFLSVAFTNADATKIPLAPYSNANLTSSPLEIPAPHMGIDMFPERSRITLTLFFRSSGRALDTLIPVPISSGGSNATYFGLRAAIFDISSMLPPHATTSIWRRCASDITREIMSKLTCLSE